MIVTTDGQIFGGTLKIGTTTVAGQLLTPLTGDLAAPDQRGRMVGIVASGLITGISQNYFSGDPVSRSDAREVAVAWAPFCSVATWYIWRSLDPLPVAN